MHTHMYVHWVSFKDTSGSGGWEGYRFKIHKGACLGREEQRRQGEQRKEFQKEMQEGLARVVVLLRH